MEQFFLLYQIVLFIIINFKDQYNIFYNFKNLIPLIFKMHVYLFNLKIQETFKIIIRNEFLVLNLVYTKNDFINIILTFQFFLILSKFLNLIKKLFLFYN